MKGPPQKSGTENCKTAQDRATSNKGMGCFTGRGREKSSGLKKKGGGGESEVFVPLLQQINDLYVQFFHLEASTETDLIPNK